MQILTNNYFDMSINSSYDELATDVDYYRTLFQLIHIHPLVNWWVNWRFWDAKKLQQITINWNNALTKDLSAWEIAILAIAFCEWGTSSTEERMVHQDKLMQAWIITPEDIIRSTESLIQYARRDHLTSKAFLRNWVENAAKICIARNAYEALSNHICEDLDRLNDPEIIILLGYITAILGYRFELRPYMINPNLIHVDWVSIYDSMFSRFDEASKQKYIDAGYYALWEVFRWIRDEICTMKVAKQEANALLNRAGKATDIMNILARRSTPPPPAASSHLRDPLSP